MQNFLKICIQIKLLFGGCSYLCGVKCMTIVWWAAWVVTGRSGLGWVDGCVLCGCDSVLW